MLLLLLAGLVLGQDCGVGDRIDCGYMGIDQQGCQDKGCCWQPAQDEGESCHVRSDWETQICLKYFVCVFVPFRSEAAFGHQILH